jgi:hypothetical protein
MRSAALRLIAVLAAAGVAAVALAGTAGAGGATSGPPTRVEIIRPFGPLGLFDRYHVTANVRGTCFSGSLADQHRPTAWRCLAGDEILDPCFESPFVEHGFLACFEAPWSTRVVGLHLTKPLPAGQANPGYPPRGFPWGIQLVSGTRCTLETGASGMVDGKRMNYGCVGGGVLVGSIDRSARTWTTLYQADPGSGPLVRRSIAIAWY